MKSVEIKGLKRDASGKKGTSLVRKDGNVPCIIYGGKENVVFSVELKSLKSIVFSPNVYVVEIDVDGKKYKTIIKDIQFHKITDLPIHVDFFELPDNKTIDISIPINITGNSVGVLSGGKLKQLKRYLKVKALYKDIPDQLDVDITSLNVGDHLMVKNLKYDNILLTEAPSDVVVSVVSSRAVAKGMDVEETAAPAAEGTAPATEEKKA